MAGLENMWVNVGRGQFHLPTRAAQVVRGTTGLVVPDLEALLKRLEYAQKFLEGTQFSYRAGGRRRRDDLPWGNRIRVHGPEPDDFGRMRLGMPYVEFDVRRRHGSFGDRAILHRDPGRHRRRREDERGPYAWAITLGATARSSTARHDRSIPEYDGHHIQITLADFSGPHKKLVERGLITEESDQHQYRFVDIVDVDTNKPLSRSSTRRAACAIRCSTASSSTGTRT